MSRKLFRVQDISGRGPYRPGFSQFWIDDEGPSNPPWWVEMGWTIEQALQKTDGEMFGGCAFASLEQLEKWFTLSERTKLDGFGYLIVRFRPDRIVAETPRQVVFEQSYPLAGLPVYGRLIDRIAA